tara:strand:- start:151 stop:282 length:132 start_codon:yes stop_codon:yes gene_type:complete
MHSDCADSIIDTTPFKPIGPELQDHTCDKRDSEPLPADAGSMI